MVQFAIESERLGVNSCWSAEAWGLDAISPLAFIAARTQRMDLGTAILQISARVPTMTAMTAMSMAVISNNRFRLGLGVSGPQVVDGLHGVPFERPLERLGEYLDILELALGGSHLKYRGEHFCLPFSYTTGKPLRLSNVADTDVPIYVAALGPKLLQLTGARANGWLGTCFIPEAAPASIGFIARGAEAAGRQLSDLDLQAGGTVAFASDVQSVLPGLKRSLAFQIGAMGSPEKNFYAQAYMRAGYEEETEKVQRLWLGGQREEATEAVPDQMALLSSFVGDDHMVKERLRAYARAGITTIRANPSGNSINERLDTLERFLDLLHTVNTELDSETPIAGGRG